MTRRSFFRLAACAAVVLLVALGVRGGRAQSIYVVGSSSQYGTLSPTTGAFTGIGTFRDSVTFQNIALSGIAFAAPENALFGVTGVDGADNSLWRFDPSSGMSTDLRTLAVPLVSLAARPTDGLLFGFTNPTGGTESLLYSYSYTTDTLTHIGGMGFLTYGAPAFAPDNTLYATDSLTGDLYRLDTATGAGTLLGTSGVPEISGLAFANGTLYGFAANQGVYALDTTNGSATQMTDYSFGSGAPLDLVYGASVMLPVLIPEPATFPLTALALPAFLFGIARKRARKCQ